MNANLFFNHNMSEATQSPWLQMIQKTNGKINRIVSLQIDWVAAQGNLNGIIRVVGSNDAKRIGYYRDIRIDLPQNSLDNELIIFQRVFAYLKITYVPEGITAGILNASIYIN